MIYYLGLPGRERRFSGSKSAGKSGLSVKTLKPGQDVEELLADALVSKFSMFSLRLIHVHLFCNFYYFVCFEDKVRLL